MLGLLRKIFGTTNDRVIKQLRKEIVNISHLEDYYVNFTDELLKKQLMSLRFSFNLEKP